MGKRKKKKKRLEKEKLLFCFSFSVEIATMLKLFITGKLAFSALKRLKREIEKSKKKA